jgi:hypothetical protein
VSELHRALPQAGHGDRFLDLLVGAKLWCDRLDDLLAGDSRCEERVDSEAVDVMLGVIAIRARLASLLEGPAHAPRDTSPVSDTEGSLLR